MATTYPNYHETLGQAVDAAHTYFAACGIVLKDERIRDVYQFDGIPYGQTKTADAEIATLKGRATRKFAHVSIYRMDSGRYELTCYYL